MRRSVLICGVNWYGDFIMSLPAMQLYRDAHPEDDITLLVKPHLAPLASLTKVADWTAALPPGVMGTLAASRAVAARHCKAAFVLPNSFRSALIPFLARIPERRGTPRHWRRAMLTTPVRTDGVADDDVHRHQSWEYVRLMGLNPFPDRLPSPRLAVAADARASCLERLMLPSDRPWIALIPGAARGPSKRWPAKCFACAGHQLAASLGACVLVLGTESERALCRDVVVTVGPIARNLAGRTTIPELVALLGMCRLAITNDSGGMHLAAASGAPVVAVFGVTDPGLTGPLGDRHRIVRPHPDAAASRDVLRQSAAASSALASIGVDAVTSAAESLLASLPESAR